MNLLQVGNTRFPLPDSAALTGKTVKSVVLVLPQTLKLRWGISDISDISDMSSVTSSHVGECDQWLMPDCGDPNKPRSGLTLLNVVVLDKVRRMRIILHFSCGKAQSRLLTLASDVFRIRESFRFNVSCSQASNDGDLTLFSVTNVR